MVNKKLLLGMLVMALVFGMTVVGCASGPKLGSPTPFQETLNAMPEISIDEKNLKFEFGGNTWIAKVDGKNYLAGTFVVEDTIEGSTLTLKQKYAWRVASTGERALGAVDSVLGFGLAATLGTGNSYAQTEANKKKNMDEENWKDTSGPNIILVYKSGPPETLSLE
jgi:hypothetical protein